MDVTVHGTVLAPVDQALIRRYDAMLWARYDRLRHCGLRVDVGPHAKGRPLNYLARVDLTLPSGEILVVEPARLDRFTAIQDALDEAARRLQHYALERGRLERRGDMGRRTRKFAVGLATFGVLACVPPPPPGVVLVPRRSPPGRVEIVPVAPGPALIWIAGYWRWEGGEFIWVAGRWAGLAPGHRAWVPGRWRHHRHGWYWVEGHWR